ncbi:hypothetical protein VP01_2467g1 [Puccinia sorghi]|uniref:Uncharacterized protein n=1 Tax=Puccinia sorghi TaxID=27349 RepID=A0A0L6V5Z1_9BASI|nr:hypothetical protein VP01_2467g1 [Puccinia sorghi]
MSLSSSLISRPMTSESSSSSKRFMYKNNEYLLAIRYLTHDLQVVWLRGSAGGSTHYVNRAADATTSRSLVQLYISYTRTLSHTKPLVIMIKKLLLAAASLPTCVLCLSCEKCGGESTHTIAERCGVPCNLFCACNSGHHMECCRCREMVPAENHTCTQCNHEWVAPHTADCPMNESNHRFRSCRRHGTHFFKSLRIVEKELEEKGIMAWHPTYLTVSLEAHYTIIECLLPGCRSHVINGDCAPSYRQNGGTQPVIDIVLAPHHEHVQLGQLSIIDAQPTTDAILIPEKIQQPSCALLLLAASYLGCVLALSCPKCGGDSSYTISDDHMVNCDLVLSCDSARHRNCASCCRQVRAENHKCTQCSHKWTVPHTQDCPMNQTNHSYLICNLRRGLLWAVLDKLKGLVALVSPAIWRDKEKRIKKE